MPERVFNLEGECFQFFARSPHGGSVKEATDEEIFKFQEELRRYELKNYYIHTPYFINLASLDNRIFYGSINAIKEDLKRAERLGAKFVVTHLGSAKDFKSEGELLKQNEDLDIPQKYQKILTKLAFERNFSQKAFSRVISGLKAIVSEKSKVPLLIEISAGSGAILGVSFEEIAFYLEEVPALSGFCFDTAHAFASGYDLRTEKELKATFNLLEKHVGKEKLKLIHLNDSLGELNSNKDRHAHLGEGMIGIESFNFLVDYFYKENYNVDVILETPTAEGVLRDLEILKSARNKYEKRKPNFTQ